MTEKTTVHFSNDKDGALSAREAADLAGRALDSGRQISCDDNSKNGKGEEEPLFRNDERYSARELS